jgi:TMEM175 potassium channel family protein
MLNGQQVGTERNDMGNQPATRHSEAPLPVVQRESSPSTELDHSMTVGRVEAFSDAVFGVAITLLILNVQVPELARDQPLSALLVALRDQWPAYLAYGLTFVTIGSLWVTHHQFLKYFARVDPSVQFLNVLFLMFVTATPFSSALLAAYLPQPDKLGVAAFVYGGIWAIQGVFMNVMWSRAVTFHLLKPSVDRDVQRRTRRTLVLGTVLCFASVGMALIAPVLSLVIMLVSTLYYVVPMLGLR